MTCPKLVTDGAGYIDSHMVKLLRHSGYQVILFDNRSTGHLDAAIGADFIKGDLRHRSDAIRTFEERQIEAAMHFAASAYVRESVQYPTNFCANNLIGTLSITDNARGGRQMHSRLRDARFAGRGRLTR